MLPCGSGKPCLALQPDMPYQHRLTPCSALPCFALPPTVSTPSSAAAICLAALPALSEHAQPSWLAQPCLISALPWLLSALQAFAHCQTGLPLPCLLVASLALTPPTLMPCLALSFACRFKPCLACLICHLPAMPTCRFPSIARRNLAFVSAALPLPNLIRAFAAASMPAALATAFVQMHQIRPIDALPAPSCPSSRLAPPAFLVPFLPLLFHHRLPCRLALSFLAPSGRRALSSSLQRLPCAHGTLPALARTSCMPALPDAGCLSALLVVQAFARSLALPAHAIIVALLCRRLAASQPPALALSSTLHQHRQPSSSEHLTSFLATAALPSCSLALPCFCQLCLSVSLPCFICIHRRLQSLAFGLPCSLGAALFTGLALSTSL